MELFQNPIWLLIGKALLASICFVFALICLLVLLMASKWRQSLAEIETECDTARDELVLQGVIIRSQMAYYQQTLMSKPERAEVEVIGDLIKQAVPIITFLMNKETSLLKWGFAGFKFVRSAYDFFASRK